RRSLGFRPRARGGLGAPLGKCGGVGVLVSKIFLIQIRFARGGRFASGCLDGLFFRRHLLARRQGGLIVRNDLRGHAFGRFHGSRHGVGGGGFLTGGLGGGSGGGLFGCARAGAARQQGIRSVARRIGRRTRQRRCRAGKRGGQLRLLRRLRLLLRL